MKKPGRKFSPEDKLSIIREADREGGPATYRKYNLSPNLLSLWREKYLSQGVSGLKGSYKRIDPEKRELEDENARLKHIIAKQALELEYKTELLKHAQIDVSKNKKSSTDIWMQEISMNCAHGLASIGVCIIINQVETNLVSNRVNIPIKGTETV